MSTSRLSDVMLDIDTGDGSDYAVQAKFAEGRVNTSVALFEYAALLAELPESSSIIQEAADAAEDEGYPTSPAAAPAMATDSVKKELAAFYDVIVSNAKKVKLAAERDMKAVVGLGKKYGISPAAAQEGNFMISFARPLATAICRDYTDNGNRKNKKINVPGGRFLAGVQALKLASCYGNGMAALAAVYGLRMDNVFEDPTVAEYLSVDGSVKKSLKAFAANAVGNDPTRANDPKTGYSANTTTGAQSLFMNLFHGAQRTKFDKILDKENHYTTTISEDDITRMVVGLYAIMEISRALVSAANGASAKKAAVAFVNDICDKEASRHATSSKSDQSKIAQFFKDINNSINAWTSDVSSVADNVVKGFSDSVSTIAKIATGQSAE